MALETLSLPSKINTEHTYPFLSKFKQQISSASETIEKTLSKDENFDDVIEKTLRSSLHFPKTKVFGKGKCYTIPTAITKMLSEKKYSSKCDLVVDLGMAWFVCDNNLILWDFIQKKMQIIAENHLVISAVFLMETPQDFLYQMEGADRLILIGSKSEIIILAGTKTKTQLFSKHKKISIPIECGGVKEFKVTANGDVFLLGVDGCLYQLEYKGWKSSIGNLIFGYGRKIRKLERGYVEERFMAPLHRILGGKPASFVDFTVMEIKSGVLMSAFDDKNDLYLWFSERGESQVRFVASVQNLPKHASKKDTNKLEDLKKHKIVSIHNSNEKESRDLFLILVTDKGARIFVKVTNNFEMEFISVIQNQKRRCEGYEQNNLVKSKCVSNTLEARSNLTNASFCKEGVFLISTKCSEASPFSDLTSFSSETTFKTENENVAENQNQTNKKLCFQESVERIGRQEKYLKLAELSSYLLCSDAAFFCYAKDENRPMRGLKPNSLSLFSAGRTFFALTPQKLRVFFKNNIFWKLNYILSNELHSETLLDFLGDNGGAESCFACLSIICCETLLLSSNEDGFTLKTNTAKEIVRQNAKSAYFTIFGGAVEPLKSKRNAEKGMKDTNGDLMLEKGGEFIETALLQRIDFKGSGRLSGLCLFLSRLLRPLWRFPVIGPVKTKEFDRKVPFVMYPSDLLQSLNNPLKKLISFLNNYKQLFYSTNINRAAPGSSKKSYSICVKSEIKSIEGLHKVSKRASELLDFLLFASKSASFFVSVFQKIPNEDKNLLFRSPFHSFISKEEPEFALRCLMSAVAKESFENFSFLKKNCPSIFRIDDALIVNGMNLLENSFKKYPNKKTFLKETEASDIEFMNAVDVSGKNFPLSAVVEKQLQAKNFVGVLKVALKMAQTVSINSNIGENDSKGDEKLKEDCFKTALFAFHSILSFDKFKSPQIEQEIFETQLSKMRRISISYKNEKFLLKLFLFLLENKFGLFLLSFYKETDLLKSFIFSQCKVNVYAANIAFSVFSQEKRYFEAAKLARHWVVIESDLKLEKRMEFALKSRRLINSIENPSKEEQNFDLVTMQYEIRTKIQMELSKNLKNAPYLVSDTKVKGIEKVETKLLTSVEMFRIAKGCRCYNEALSLLENHFIEDIGGKTADELWREIVNKELKIILSDGKPNNWKVCFENVVGSLIRKHVGSAVLRIGTIAFELEKINNKHGESVSGWTVDFLLRCGISATVLSKTYCSALDTVLTEKSSTEKDDSKRFLGEFNGNCQITLSVTKLLDQLLKESQRRSFSEKSIGEVRELGRSLIRKWENKRLKGGDEREERVKSEIDKRFFVASLRLSGQNPLTVSDSK